MRSAIASRAVSISTGTRSPDARSVRHTSRPSMPGRPTSSTTASGPVAVRASACSPSAASSVSYPASVSARRSASRRARSSSTIRTFIQPILTAGAAFFGCSYMALTLLLRNTTTLVAMRTPQKVTALVLVGAVGIASAAYGIGSAAGGGSATAESNASNAATAQRGSEPGPPPGYDDLADTLGVDADELAQAIQDFHDQQKGEKRDDMSAALAKALGISVDKVNAAFDQIKEGHKSRFATQLAIALGVDAAKVEAALEKLAGERPESPGDFAEALASELGVDTAKVEEALESLRPRPGARPPGDHRGAPLAKLAAALDVTRAELRKALRVVRAGATVRLGAARGEARGVHRRALQPRRRRGRGRPRRPTAPQRRPRSGRARRPRLRRPRPRRPRRPRRSRPRRPGRPGLRSGRLIRAMRALGSSARGLSPLIRGPALEQAPHGVRARTRTGCLHRWPEGHCWSTEALGGRGPQPAPC